MEAPPPSYETSGDDAKGKEEKKKDKKSLPPVVRGIFAGRMHASEPQRTERIESEKPPLIVPLGKEVAPAEQRPAEDDGNTPETPAEHPAELAVVHDDLWRQPEAAPPAAPEAADTDPAATPPPPAEAAPDSFEDIMRSNGLDHELAPAHEELQDNDERPQPAHGHWDEAHTIHVNAPPAEQAPDRPPVASSAPELEQLFEAPAAAVPEDHPEAAGEPLPPMTEEEKFQDIMQEADMGDDFNRAASVEPEPQPAAASAYDPWKGSRASTGSPFSGGPASPRVPSGPPPPGSPPYPMSTGGPNRPWYPPPASRPGTPFGARAAEAGLLGAALAPVAAAAAESGVAGAAAGAVAGGVAGGVAGYGAGRQAARHEMRGVQQDMEQQQEEHQRQVDVLTNQQRLTNDEVTRLTRSNEQLMADQRKAAAERTATVPAAAPEMAAAGTAAAAIAPERVTAVNPNERVERGWVDMVVDKRTGQLVNREGVNNFGNEFEAERRHNTAPPDPVADALAAAQAAAVTAAEVTAAKYSFDHPGQAGTLDSGQVPPGHGLPAGAADVHHRLPAPSNPVANAVKNPLVWTGAAILLGAFFAAAFI